MPGHPRAKEVFDRAVVERNAEGWDCAPTWMDNADALADMARAEQAPKHSPEGQKRSAQAEAARARSAHAARKSAAPTQECATAPVNLQGHDRRSRSR